MCVLSDKLHTVFQMNKEQQCVLGIKSFEVFKGACGDLNQMANSIMQQNYTQACIEKGSRSLILTTSIIFSVYCRNSTCDCCFCKENMYSVDLIFKLYAQ